MSATRNFWIFPKSGEQILKGTLGQFKNIIVQLGEGIKKVKSQQTKNTKETTEVQKKTEVKVQKLQEKADVKVNELQKKNEALAAVLGQAEVAAKNIEAILNDEIPLSIGGGIGQSRVFMYLLRTAHIGEVSVTVWPKALRDICAKKNIHVLE